MIVLSRVFRCFPFWGATRETGRLLVESPWPAFPGALEVTAISLVMTASSEARWVLPRSLQKGHIVDSQDDFGGWGSWLRAGAEPLLGTAGGFRLAELLYPQKMG